MFLLRSGLVFLFWALEVPEPRVRKRPLSPTNRAFSSLLVRALPVPETGECFSLLSVPLSLSFLSFRHELSDYVWLYGSVRPLTSVIDFL